MNQHFHLFVYGSLRRNGSAASHMSAAEWVGPATVGGILYDIDGAYNALVVYGATPVKGEVWKCPASMLSMLDEYEGVEESLFRRVGVEVTLADGSVVGCWAYVAGPKLSRKLIPARRVVV